MNCLMVEPSLTAGSGRKRRNGQRIAERSRVVVVGDGRQRCRSVDARQVAIAHRSGAVDGADRVVAPQLRLQHRQRR